MVCFMHNWPRYKHFQCLQAPCLVLRQLYPSVCLLSNRHPADLYCILFQSPLRPSPLLRIRLSLQSFGPPDWAVLLDLQPRI